VIKINNLFRKVLAWRAVSIVSMLLTLWVLTGDLVQSTSVTITVQIIQTIVHAVFESVWRENKEKV